MKPYIIPVTIPNKILYFNLDNNLSDPWGARTGSSSGSGIFSTADKYTGTHSASFNGVLGTNSGSYRLITIPSINYGTNGVSVSFWMNRLGNSANDYHVFALGFLYMWGQGTTNNFQINNVAGTNITLTNNVWNHVVVTVTSANVVNIYVNSTRVITNITASGAYAGTGTGRIGGVPVGNGGANLNGYIDEFKVYGKILTQAEVSAIYGDYAI